jgi:hypothetical protein
LRPHEMTEGMNPSVDLLRPSAPGALASAVTGQEQEVVILPSRQLDGHAALLAVGLVFYDPALAAFYESGQPVEVIGVRQDQRDGLHGPSLGVMVTCGCDRQPNCGQDTKIGR